jgi:uncharacterized membrane protein YeaQ/YmgE (transglycosylase-associated protein family)
MNFRSNVLGHLPSKSIVAALALGLIAALLAWYVVSPTSKDVFGWLGTVVSTFVGAWIAFRFNALKSERDKADREVEAGNTAIMILIEFLDRLLQFEENFTAAARGKTSAWFAMRPGAPLDVVEFAVDKNSLSFLLKKHPMTWRAVVLEERRYAIVAKAIDDRNKLYADRLLPAMEAAGFGHAQNVLLSDVEKAVGPTISQALKDGTAFIIENVEKDVASLNTAISDLRKCLIELYPDREFVPLPPRIKSESLT